MSDHSQPIVLDRSELKGLMAEAVEEAFVRMGVDASEPIEMQKDFQHLREWRVAVGAVRTKGILSIVAVLVSGAAAAAWIGFRHLITGE